MRRRLMAGIACAAIVISSAAYVSAEEIMIVPDAGIEEDIDLENTEDMPEDNIPLIEDLDPQQDIMSAQEEGDASILLSYSAEDKDNITDSSVTVTAQASGVPSGNYLFSWFEVEADLPDSIFKWTEIGYFRDTYSELSCKEISGENPEDSLLIDKDGTYLAVIYVNDEQLESNSPVAFATFSIGFHKSIRVEENLDGLDVEDGEILIQAGSNAVLSPIITNESEDAVTTKWEVYDSNLRLIETKDGQDTYTASKTGEYIFTATCGSDRVSVSYRVYVKNITADKDYSEVENAFIVEGYEGKPLELASPITISGDKLISHTYDWYKWTDEDVIPLGQEPAYTVSSPADGQVFELFEMVTDEYGNIWGRSSYMKLQLSPNPNPTDPTQPGTGENPDPQPGTGGDEPAHQPEHTHSYGKWTVSKQATALANGVMVRKCSCGQKEEKLIAKLKATGKFNKKSVTVKKKKTYKKLKVTGMAPGDYIKSVKSSKTKVLNVKSFKKTGAITLKGGKKKGKAKLTVTLASGKVLTLTIKVK